MSIRLAQRLTTAATITLTVLMLLMGLATKPVLAADSPKGAEIFSIHCAGCHPNGSNIIRRGKTLRQRALHRYGMDSVEAIANLVANGKNNMSAYKDRLSPEEIEAVSGYVLDQAAKDWRS